MKKFIITLGLVLASLCMSNMVPVELKQQKKETISPSNSKAFRDSVKKNIYKYGIEHPELVYFQFREESGNGGSDLSINHFNLFGMKYPTRRETLAIGKTRSGFAIYKTWKDSIKDYLIWQETYYKGLSRSQYLRKLRTVYTSDENYLKNYL